MGPLTRQFPFGAVLKLRESNFQSNIFYKFSIKIRMILRPESVTTRTIVEEPHRAHVLWLGPR